MYAIVYELVMHSGGGGEERKERRGGGRKEKKRVMGGKERVRGGKERVRGGENNDERKVEERDWFYPSLSLVLFILSYHTVNFTLQVRRETHIGNVFVLCVGLLWIAYSVFKIARYCIVYCKSCESEQ